MSGEDYVKLALRTESARFDPSSESQWALARIACFMPWVGSSADRAKRFLFYGKTPQGEPPPLPDEPSVAVSPSSLDARLLHALLGCVSEVGEMWEMFVRHLHGVNTPIDFDNLFEESGDLFWYLAVLLSFCAENDAAEKRDRWFFSRIMEANIAKLRARYPNKFSEEQAANRDLVKEQQALKAAEKPAVISLTARRGYQSEELARVAYTSVLAFWQRKKDAGAVVPAHYLMPYERLDTISKSVLESSAMTVANYVVTKPSLADAWEMPFSLTEHGMREARVRFTQDDGCIYSNPDLCTPDTSDRYTVGQTWEGRDMFLSRVGWLHNALETTPDQWFASAREAAEAAAADLKYVPRVMAGRE